MFKKTKSNTIFYQSSIPGIGKCTEKLNSVAQLSQLKQFSSTTFVGKITPLPTHIHERAPLPYPVNFPDLNSIPPNLVPPTVVKDKNTNDVVLGNSNIIGLGSQTIKNNTDFILYDSNKLNIEVKTI